MAAQNGKEFLGQGWANPVELDQTGEVKLATYEEDVHQAIRLILGTNYGERIMRPDFGANLRALAFEPLSTTTAAMARHYVEQALIQWEPRIDNIEVNVRSDRPQGRLLIDVQYRVRTTNTFYNLVYPFYLLEGRAT